MAFYARFDQATYTPVAAAPNEDVFRYCDYPGERLLQKVKFEVNGNPLDEYDVNVYNFHRQFNVQPNKRVAWDRLVGQETPQEAYLSQQSLVQPSSRVKLDYYDGYQTPKGTHDALSVMVPLLFWLTIYLNEVNYLSQCMVPKTMQVCSQQATLSNCGELS
jgi:hypothetical protein